MESRIIITGLVAVVLWMSLVNEWGRIGVKGRADLGRLWWSIVVVVVVVYGCCCRDGDGEADHEDLTQRLHYVCRAR
jgi:hypothetical protein